MISDLTDRLDYVSIVVIEIDLTLGGLDEDYRGHGSTRF